MNGPLRTQAIAQIGFFSVLPGAAVAGALALAPALGLAGAISARPSLLRTVWAARPLWLVFLLGFAAWAALSSLWSPTPGGEQALKVVLMAATGLLFLAAAAGDSARAARCAGGAAFIVLTGMLAIEAAFGMPMNRAANTETLDWVLARNPGRGGIVLMALLWGVLGALLSTPTFARIAVATFALLTTTLLATQFGHFANVLALGAGVCAFAIGYAAPRWGVLALSFALALLVLGAPLSGVILSDPLFGADLPYSWASRIEAWRYVAAHIGEAPMFGHGLDASRAVDDVIVLRGIETPIVPAHPHNFSLQVWYETGALGALLAAGAVVFGGRTIARRLGGQRAKAGAACAAIVSCALIAHLSYSAWQEWWQAAMFVSAAMVAAIPTRDA